MSNQEPGSQTDSSAGPESSARNHRKITPALAVIGALSAGLLGGALAWLAGEAVYGRFEPPPTPTTSTTGPPAEERPGLIAARYRSDLLAAGCVYGFLGAALGLMLGLAGGLLRGSLKRAALAGGIGLLLGAAIGAGALAGLLPFYQAQLKSDTPILALPLLLQGLLGAAVGLAGGLALSMGVGGARTRWFPVTLGGLLGGLTGGVLSEIMRAVLFPLTTTGSLVTDTWTSRLATQLLTALCVALFASLMLTGKRRPDSPGTIASQE